MNAEQLKIWLELFKASLSGQASQEYPDSEIVKDAAAIADLAWEEYQKRER